MIRVKMIDCKNKLKFMDDMEEFINNNDYLVKDIKFSKTEGVCGCSYCAMILYELSDEYYDFY